MLIQCPECAHDVSEKAISCPNCGYPMKLQGGAEKPLCAENTKPRAQRRKKKHKKLPNGFGSIKFLGKNRRNPYAAYPPAEGYTLNGSPITVPAIGYFKDWYSAFDALQEYKHNPYDIRSEDLTFADVYGRYYKEKYENGKRKFSKQSENSTKAAFNNCSALHSRRFRDLRKADLQAVVDGCKLKHASLELIVGLYHGMYKYALENDFLDRDYSRFVTINIPDDDEKGVPFTQEELDILWGNKDMPGVDTILIMVYSGFRVSAYRDMEVNLEERYFRGGVKTKAGKNRIVPIHSAIYDMVKECSSGFFDLPVSGYRKRIFAPVLEQLGISLTAGGAKHTPHDCRHTFSWLCDKYNVDDLSKHLLMGHSIGGDIERSVYGHRTVEELREEIEKIRAQYGTK